MKEEGITTVLINPNIATTYRPPKDSPTRSTSSPSHPTSLRKSSKKNAPTAYCSHSADRPHSTAEWLSHENGSARALQE